MNENRQSGFYWAYFHDYWTIGEYFEKDEWLIIGCEQTYKSQFFIEIGERIERT